MSDTPIGDAVKKAGTALAVEGGASKDQGASISGTLSHVSAGGKREAGVQAGVSQQSGWSITGFFKRMWGG